MTAPITARSDSTASTSYGEQRYQDDLRDAPDRIMEQHPEGFREPPERQDRDIIRTAFDRAQRSPPNNWRPTSIPFVMSKRAGTYAARRLLEENR